jgi:hypothetical protein
VDSSQFHGFDYPQPGHELNFKLSHHSKFHAETQSFIVKFSSKPRLVFWLNESFLLLIKVFTSYSSGAITWPYETRNHFASFRVFIPRLFPVKLNQSKANALMKTHHIVHSLVALTAVNGRDGGPEWRLRFQVSFLFLRWK